MQPQFLMSARPDMYESNNHTPKGFTIVELLVSIALLSLILFGIIQLFPRAVATGRIAEQLTTATYLAQAQIETILGTEYTTVTTGTFEPRHLISGSFERQTIVQFIDPTTLDVTGSDQGLKQIVVTVFYPTASGERSIILPMIIASH